MRLSQSHPLQTCTIQASWHIVASFPSLRDSHPAIVQAAFPTENNKTQSAKHHQFFVLIHIHMYVYASVCICKCIWERERERDCQITSILPNWI